MRSRPLQPCEPSRRRASRSAFTLIELLAVIAVMVLLLSFTLPILRGGGSMNTVGWDIASIIEQARAYAQANNTYVWVGFNEAEVSDSNTRRVGVFVVASKTGTAAAATTANNLQIVGRIRAFDNVRITTASALSYSGAPTTARFDIATGSDELSSGFVLPAKVAYRGRTLTSNCMLEIDPTGTIAHAATANSPASGFHWIGLGLTATRGVEDVTVDNALVDTLALAIAPLTGRIDVRRPESVIPAAQGGDGN